MYVNFFFPTIFWALFLSFFMLRVLGFNLVTPPFSLQLLMLEKASLLLLLSHVHQI